MRDFLMFSNRGATFSDFTLKDLPGSGGRMDLNARCVISALWYSHGVREDTRFYISLNGKPGRPILICFDGARIERISPDERNIALWIKKSIKRLEKDKNETEGWFETNNGILLKYGDFQDLVSSFADRHLYLLDESGKELRDAEIKSDPVFIVGDNKGLPAKQLQFLEEKKPEKIKLGPLSYFSTQSITLVHNELDLRNQP